MSRAIILFIGTVAHLDNCARLLFAFHINKHDMSQKSFRTNYHLLYLLITICDLNEVDSLENILIDYENYKQYFQVV